MYEQFYGFSERPFQLTPDPAYFFESITHKKALSYLGYGLNQGEGFVVITGEVGSGKSTLVAHLKEKLDDRMSVGEVVTSALDGEEMIHVAARSFGLDVEGRDKAAALAAIEHFLHEEARNGKRCLLIVDESQNLSIGALEELRMLSNFQLGAHPLLQTLLLGQPEFKRLLAGSDELEPGGIPRKINQVMTRLLLLGAVEEQSTIDLAMLEAVIEEMAGDSSAEDSPVDDRIRPDPSKKAAQAVAEAKREESDRARASTAPAEDRGVEQGLAEAQIAAIEAAFGGHENQIAKLRRDVSELQQADPASNAGVSEAIEERLATMEARLAEQEASIRHVLELLIAHFETDGRREAA